MNPFPTNVTLQLAHWKQSLCQWRSSKEMNRVPPIPLEIINNNKKQMTNDIKLVNPEEYFFK
jgi:hypothetical protein